MGLKGLLVDGIPAPLVRLFAAPYVSGDSIEAAVAAADRVHREQGLLSTIDMLGESIETAEDARRCRDRYLEILEHIRERPHCTVSLKPTSMGLKQGTSPALENIEAVVRRARELGRGVTIDMEDRSTVDATLEIYRALRARYDNVGTVLQSKLLRTPNDVERLSDVGGRFRICLGAYPEVSEVAHTSKPRMKEALYELALRMLELGYYVELATHDEALLDRILAEAERRRVPKDRFEIQWLLGVPVTRMRDKYARQGVRMRLYVPYCDDWSHATRYLKRRLLLNPNLMSYVLSNLVLRGR